MKSCPIAFLKISRRTWFSRTLRIVLALAVGGLVGYLFYLFSDAQTDVPSHPTPR